MSKSEECEVPMHKHLQGGEPRKIQLLIHQYYLKHIYVYIYIYT